MQVGSTFEGLLFTQFNNDAKTLSTNQTLKHCNTTVTKQNEKLYNNKKKSDGKNRP